MTDDVVSHVYHVLNTQLVFNLEIRRIRSDPATLFATLSEQDIQNTNTIV
jgi:hypothetical protein